MAGNTSFQVSPHQASVPLPPQLFTVVPFRQRGFLGTEWGQYENKFFSSTSLFLPALLVACSWRRVGDLAVTQGTWYPAAEWLCQRWSGLGRAGGSCSAARAPQPSHPSACSTQRQHHPPNQNAKSILTGLLGAGMRLLLSPVLWSCH